MNVASNRLVPHEMIASYDARVAAACQAGEPLRVVELCIEVEMFSELLDARGKSGARPFLDLLRTVKAERRAKEEADRAAWKAERDRAWFALSPQQRAARRAGAMRGRTYPR